MSGGGKTKQTQTQDQRQTVELPAWMSEAGQRTFQGAEAAAAANPIQAYGAPIRAGASHNQTTAGNVAFANAGTGRGDLDTARKLTMQAGTAAAPRVTPQAPFAARMTPSAQAWRGMTAPGQRVATAGAAPTVGGSRQAWAGMTPAAQSVERSGAAREGAAAIYDASTQSGAPQVRADRVSADAFDGAAAARYMNPYSDQVVRRSLDEMGRRNAMERQDLNDQMVAGKAYGGDRHALLEAEVRRGQQDNMLNYIARSNADAYSSAQGQFERDRRASLDAQAMNQSAGLQADTATASFLDAMSGRNIEATNRARAFGAAAANDVGARDADREQQSFLANMAAANEASGRNADRSQEAMRFVAAAANDAEGRNADRDQEARLSNQDFLGRFMLSDQEAFNRAWGADADREQDASRFTATAANTAASANADRAQDAGRFNANWLNEMARANADRNLEGQRLNGEFDNSMLDRMLAAGGQYGDIGNAENTLLSRDIDNLLRTGGVEQEIADNELRAQYDEFLRMQDAPMDRYRDIAAILAGTPRNVTTTGRMTGTGVTQQKTSPINTILGLGSIGASIFSDRRLKRGVHLLRRAASGLGVYAFRYMWDDPAAPPRIGVMAQEVERLVPEALGPRVAGFMTVDYSRLEGALA